VQEPGASSQLMRQGDCDGSPRLTLPCHSVPVTSARNGAATDRCEHRFPALLAGSLVLPPVVP